MPRKAPEKMYPITVRVTRTQRRKLMSLGGAAWLRSMISKAYGPRHGREPVEHLRSLSERNRIICSDPRPAKEIAEEFHISPQRVWQIRRMEAKT